MLFIALSSHGNAGRDNRVNTQNGLVLSPEFRAEARNRVICAAAHDAVSQVQYPDPTLRNPFGAPVDYFNRNSRRKRIVLRN
jgi:hypothetical protein